MNPAEQTSSKPPIGDKEPSAAKGSSGGSPLLPQLNCEPCRARKIKCDKRQPSCSACLAAHVRCVPIHRLRLPRGRHATGHAQVTKAKASSEEGPRDDLRQRIRRLEMLVSRAAPAAPVDMIKTGIATHAASAGRPAVMQHPDHFWADLTDAVHGLYDVVESSPDEAEDDTAQTHAEVSIQALHGHPWDISVLGLSGLGASFVEPAPILQDRLLVDQLCGIYLDQVDPILKILHRPTLSRHLLDGSAYLGYPEGHPSVEALDSAVLYVAVNSMEDEQCQALLGRDRAGLLSATRQTCESAMERAGLLTTRDMAVLQAFVLYLAGRQVEEPSRAVWTLLAVAVRVARALGVNLPQKNESFFLRQMRQHLWLTICLMDVQASFGMTSQPLISVDEACVEVDRMPRHINDADYGPGTVAVLPERSGLTDTTYALMKYRIQEFGRRTHFVPLSSSTNPGDKDKALRDAQALCDTFTQDLTARVFGIDPAQSPFAWLVFHSAQCFMFGANAALYKGQPDDTKQGRPVLLRACTQVLEKTVLMHTDPRGMGFRWSITVRWHILAMALAECYVCGRATNPDTELLRHVWPTMEAAYAHHASIIGRHRGGKLRGPLSKLMARARQTVEAVTGPGDRRKEKAVDNRLVDTDPTESTPDFTTVMTDTTDNSWDTSWDACWDDLVSAAALDDNMAVFDTQFYEHSI